MEKFQSPEKKISSSLKATAPKKTESGVEGKKGNLTGSPQYFFEYRTEFEEETPQFNLCASFVNAML